ncbi:MAG: hypothetical protein ACU0FT_04210 [Paracoccus sp. (in: a-proteobacteria)]|uniref:hypothetical protein n=1 Tax=Paracoccus sp. TaxID=267 RepID=UPI00405A1170
MPTQPRANSGIAATAFRLMELAPFSSFADDTPQAQDAAQEYPRARRMCLEACDWSFASVVAYLPEARPETAPDPELPFSYVLPGDCLRMMQTMCSDIRWRLDRRTVRADASGPLAIRYIADVEDEQILPASFQTAIAYRLAALMSPRWVGAENKAQGLEQRAEMSLRSAMKLDARSASIERYDGADPGVADWAAWAVR